MSLNQQPVKTLTNKMLTCQSMAYQLLEKNDPTSVFKRGEVLGRLALILEIIVESRWSVGESAHLIKAIHTLAHPDEQIDIEVMRLAQATLQKMEEQNAS
ncbi:MAG: hypothetical protein ABIH67_03810 [Candidatus Uhrbacteria bacterium]